MKKLVLSDLRVDSFSTAKPLAYTHTDDSYTGFYGGACISLPPNCLQTARKCV
ncbi:MAG TPA: hypothetical protein VFT45_09420 [Longimicrobium sp.]|nr:hypothetical protein [Longimicrobium sp.]